MVRRLVCVALLLVAGVATGEPDESSRVEAKRLKDLGAAAMARGDNLGALDLFVAANRLYPSPNLRFNVALALSNLGRTPEAAAEFDAFLVEATPETSREALDHARAHIDQAGRRLARLTVRHDVAGAEVRVDGRFAGTVPLPRPLWLLPGNHTLFVAASGRAPRTIDVTLLAGELRLLSLVDDPPPPPVSPSLTAPPPSPPISRRALGWGLGVGAAVVVAGAALGIGLGVHANPSVPSSELGPFRTQF